MKDKIHCYWYDDKCMLDLKPCFKQDVDCSPCKRFQEYHSSIKVSCNHYPQKSHSYIQVSYTDYTGRHCKEKNNELCYEEMDVVLPEHIGCPKCTDPKILNIRRKRAEEQRKAHRSCNYQIQSHYIENMYKPSNAIEKKETIFKKIFRKIFG